MSTYEKLVSIVGEGRARELAAAGEVHGDELAAAREVLRREVRQLLAAAEVHRLQVRALGHGPQAVQ